ncbi:bacitracin ABC transporter ATP-binding protein [Cytobacillus depressus]|uniref:Bacitracin ABC transporter ATP-binding protein n=1 Tax=Cytobacillus depressus TaxID=1602942 RepID=A0A6L3V2F7_9BACI|nr:hypothetical protein [Cytobacillus depressus]KAB2330417.1 bacitracin ABC transporter ATP-binding protein [Cytobacillus depressus]
MIKHTRPLLTDDFLDRAAKEISQLSHSPAMDLKELKQFQKTKGHK